MLLNYICDQFSFDSDHGDGCSEDRQEKVYNFLNAPLRLEKVPPLIISQCDEKPILSLVNIVWCLCLFFILYIPLDNTSCSSLSGNHTGCEKVLHQNLYQAVERKTNEL